MRFTETKFNTWQAAVGFGFIYTMFANILSLGALINGQLMLAVYQLNILSSTGAHSRIEMLAAKLDLPLQETIDYIAPHFQ